MPHVILIVSQIAVGSAALLARMGLDAGLSAVTLTAWRLLVASLVLVPVVRWRGQSLGVEALARRDVLRLVCAGVALGGHFATWFASLQYVAVAPSTLLVSTTPVWAALGLWLTGQGAPTVRFWIGLLPALLGAWLVTGGSAQSLVGNSEVLGYLLAVSGAILLAAYFLLTARLQSALTTSRVVAWTYTTAAVGMVVLSLTTTPTDQLVPASASAWLSVVGMALLPQLMGHTMLNWSLRHFSPATVGMATLLEPVFAGVLAWWLLGERLSAMQIGGALLLLSGVGMVLSAGDRRRVTDYASQETHRAH